MSDVEEKRQEQQRSGGFDVDDVPQSFDDDGEDDMPGLLGEAELEEEEAEGDEANEDQESDGDGGSWHRGEGGGEQGWPDDRGHN